MYSTSKAFIADVVLDDEPSELVGAIKEQVDGPGLIVAGDRTTKLVGDKRLKEHTATRRIFG